MSNPHLIINALVSLATGALPSDVQVLDGWTGSEEAAAKVVAIGHGPTVDAAAVSVRTVLDEGSLCDARREHEVRCSAAVWDGEMDYTAKRGELQDILDALNQAIAGDRSLGGAVYDAWMSPDWDIYQVGDAEGTTVQADFMITVSVFVPIGG